MKRGFKLNIKTIEPVLLIAASCALIVVILLNLHSRSAGNETESIFPVNMASQTTAEANLETPALSTQTSVATETAAPTPNPDGLDVSGENSYTIAWLSDTQNYFKRDHKEIFYEMTHFLRRNRERLKLRYVVHTGDIVQNFDDEEQWKYADEYMNELNGKVPYGVLAGNHDANAAQDYTYYKRYFGESRFKEQPNYGGSFEDNIGHYDLIRLGKDKFVFVYMSYGPGSDGLEWMNSVLEQYRDRIGIVCLHDYFDTDMTLLPTGKAVLKKVVEKNPNVYMVLCGHRYNVGYSTVSFDDDGDGENERDVYQVIMNYQAAGDIGGSGYMMFIQVLEPQNELKFISYSPYTNDHKYFDNGTIDEEKYPVDPNNEEFTLEIPW